MSNSTYALAPAHKEAVTMLECVHCCHVVCEGGIAGVAPYRGCLVDELPRVVSVA